MSTIVDLRLGQVGAACTRLVDTTEEPALSHPVKEAATCEAEIILFPKIHASLLQRPRKRLTRRHSIRSQKLSAARDQQDDPKTAD